MTQIFELVVNGAAKRIEASAETPLIYVLRNELGLKGTRYGCGLEQCGCCMVLIDGEPVPGEFLLSLQIALISKACNQVLESEH